MALTENICQNQLSVVLVVWEFLAFSFARSASGWRSWRWTVIPAMKWMFFYTLGRFVSHSDLQFQSFILERRVAKFSFLVHFDILDLLPVFPLQIVRHSYLPPREDFDPSKLDFSCLWMHMSGWIDNFREQYTSHVTFFSFTARTCNDVWYHIGSSVGARHPIHVSCAWLFVLSLSLFDPHLVLFRVFLYLPLLLPEPWLLPFSSSMWMSSEQDPLCTPPIEESSGPLAINAPLTFFEGSNRCFFLLSSWNRSSFSIWRGAQFLFGNFSRKSMVRGHLNNQTEDELAEGGEDEQILRQRFCFLYCLEENKCWARTGKKSRKYFQKASQVPWYPVSKCSGVRLRGRHTDVQHSWFLRERWRAHSLLRRAGGPRAMFEEECGRTHSYFRSLEKYACWKIWPSDRRREMRRRVRGTLWGLPNVGPRRKFCAGLWGAGRPDP